MNPVIQQWMVGISSQEVATLLPTITVPVSQFERFVVKRGAMEASPGGDSSDNYMSADEAPETSKAKEVPACNGLHEEVMFSSIPSRTPNKLLTIFRKKQHCFLQTTVAPLIFEPTCAYALWALRSHFLSICLSACLGLDQNSGNHCYLEVYYYVKYKGGLC